MVPMIAENPVLENGGCSLVTDPPKYTRRRVSAVRDFPLGCGPNAPRVSVVRDFPLGCGPNAPRSDINGNEATCCSKIFKDTAHDHLDIESQKENSEHAVGDSTENHASLNGVDKTTYVLNGGEIQLRKVENSDDGLLDLSDHMPLEMRMRSCSSSETSQVHTEYVTKESLHETQEPSKDLTEGKPEISAGESNSTKGIETIVTVDNFVTEEKMVAEGSLLPHHPIPSNVVWKERTYPPRRRVSAVRCFPAGCGTNVPLNSNCSQVDASEDHRQMSEEKMGSENGKADARTNIKEIRDHIDDDAVLGAEMDEVACGTNDEAQTECDKDDFEEINVQPPESPEKHEQLKMVHERTIEIGASEGIERKELIVYRRDKGERKRATIFPGSNTALQAENTICSNQKEGSVIVYALMAASNSHWKNIRWPDKVTPSSTAAKGKRQNKCIVESVDRRQELKSGVNEAMEDTEKREEEERMDKTTSSTAAAKGKMRKKCIVDKPQKLKSVVNEAIEDAEQMEEDERMNKTTSSTADAKGKRRKKCIVDKPQKLKSFVNEAMVDAEQREEEERMNKTGPSVQVPGIIQREMVIWDEDNSPENVQQQNQSRGFNVNLLPFGASTSSDRGTRNKVRETLRLFQVILRKLLQEQETKPKEERNGKSRIDLQAAKMLKSKGKYVNTGPQIVGTVPGVEVGDEFHYRVELMMIGLHRQSQAGIDCTKLDGKVIATSIVASGGYDNNVENSDMLTFMGQGGNMTGGDKKPEDQKLERGNLGLKNSIDVKNYVRVIRGVKETKPSETEGRPPKVITTYTYDGLYTVERYWQEIGQSGKKVYKFELKRIPDQPELSWKEVNKSNKGNCVDDISEGKEKFRISAINTLDNEKPPPFKYITEMMYPDWCKPLPLQGCNCKNGCSDLSRCPCVVKNGGEIPFNFDGAIVEAKPLVFECGPSCKCPASCHNRVSQHGIKFHLEIFKTKHRGWGVRSLTSIPSGSFICEYIGELLEDKEAEKRTGNDEYLFDIGQDYNDHDHSLWEGLSGLMPDVPSSSREVVDMGFTIDAAQFGNMGRFINHSCSPNLYAQNVLYDHDDRRIPHIMFFAAENIPPLQELTYHYNYTIGQVYDKDGNVKVKNCYCGSSDCSGRMY